MTTRQVLSSVAYSTTDYDDTRRVAWAVVPIPEGCRYVDCSIRKTTELGNFHISAPVFVRHTTLTDRIVEVRAWAEARNRLFARSWIGIELAVTVEPR